MGGAVLARDDSRMLSVRCVPLRYSAGEIMRELAGKTAFVTGGANGIGLALGRAFAQAGMKVMLADVEAVLAGLDRDA